MGIAENPLPFPTATNHINEYTYPSLQSMVFPTLFLFGAEDTTNRDRVSSVSLTESNQYLLKYCFLNQNNDFVYPFAKHD